MKIERNAAVLKFIIMGKIYALTHLFAVIIHALTNIQNAWFPV